VSNHSPTSNDQIERAVAGYQELIHAISTSRPPEFPDSSLTMAQMKVLMLVSIGGETRMSDLAPRLGISLSTLSSLVERLVEASYAQRRDDPRDRRSVLVSLTQEGRALLDRFQELGAEQLRELLSQLSPGELSTVIHAIEVLVAAARRLASSEDTE
jgi:DNA-binding MarR family transcriptional regulator